MNDFLARLCRHPGTWAGTAALCVGMVGSFEGLRLHPYLDSVGVPTVCYGATAADHVDLSRSYTKAECQKMLAADLPKYDAQVKKCLTPAAYAALPNHRHAAIVSFTYNLGGGTLCKSSVARLLNAGQVRRACDAILLYDHAGGNVLRGLTRRRQLERKLCLMDD